MSAELVGWLGLVVAGLGVLGAVNAWFGTRAGDGEYVIYVLMILGGILAFVILA